MKSSQRRYELTDVEWEQIAPFFPICVPGTKGHPYHDIRTTVNGVLCGLPAVVRHGVTFQSDKESGIPFTNALPSGKSREFLSGYSMSCGLMPTCKTSVWIVPPARSTSTAPVQKKGPNTSVNEHIGISRGGKTTKIHATVDALGYPLHVQLTGGNVHDAAVAVELLEKTPVKRSIIMADKAYRGKSIRDAIEALDCTHCIQPQSNDKEKWEVDWWQYKEHSNVECFFQKLKQYRRLATRYEKLAVRFLGFVHLCCILIWLK